MARSGSSERAQQKARRQRKKAHASVPPESTSRPSASGPPPLPKAEDSTEIRERPQLASPAELPAELDDEFFDRAALVEPSDDFDEEQENPFLSPDQQRRRQQLRRQVAWLMAALAAFSLAASFLGFPK